MVELSAQLAVSGEYLQRPRHPAPVAGGGEDVPAGGQVIQGDHAESEQSPTGTSCRDPARSVIHGTLFRDLSTLSWAHTSAV